MTTTPELWTAEECAELNVTPADMARAWQAVMEWHRSGHLVGRIAVALREQRENTERTFDVAYQFDQLIEQARQREKEKQRQP